MSIGRLIATLTAFGTIALTGPATAAQPPAGWVFKTEGGAGVAEGSLPLRLGQTVVLFIDCIAKRPQMQVGYMSDDAGMNQTQRDLANRYSRDLFIDEPRVVARQGGRILTSTTWNSGNGGSGKMTRADLERFRLADRLTLEGGKTSMDLSVANLNNSIARLLPSCS